MSLIEQIQNHTRTQFQFQISIETQIEIQIQMVLCADELRSPESRDRSLSPSSRTAAFLARTGLKLPSLSRVGSSANTIGSAEFSDVRRPQKRSWHSSRQGSRAQSAQTSRAHSAQSSRRQSIERYSRRQSLDYSSTVHSLQSSRGQSLQSSRSHSIESAVKPSDLESKHLHPYSHLRLIFALILGFNEFARIWNDTRVSC